MIHGIFVVIPENLHYQGVIRLWNIKSCKPNSDPIIEYTGDNQHNPTSTYWPSPKTKHSQVDIACLSHDQQKWSYKKNAPSTPKDCAKILSYSNHIHHLKHNIFTSVLNGPIDDFYHSEYYLNIAHNLKGNKETQEKHHESHINLSDFIPEPIWKNNVLRLS